MSRPHLVLFSSQLCLHEQQARTWPYLAFFYFGECGSLFRLLAFKTLPQKKTRTAKQRNQRFPAERWLMNHQSSRKLPVLIKNKKHYHKDMYNNTLFQVKMLKVRNDDRVRNKQRFVPIVAGLRCFKPQVAEWLMVFVCFWYTCVYMCVFVCAFRRPSVDVCRAGFWLH